MYCVVCQMLLSVSSCDVNVPDNDHTTPLIMAAMQGNRDMVDILVCLQETLLFFSSNHCLHGVHECTPSISLVVDLYSAYISHSLSLSLLPRVFLIQGVFNIL